MLVTRRQKSSRRQCWGVSLPRGASAPSQTRCLDGLWKVGSVKGQACGKAGLKAAPAFPTRASRVRNCSGQFQSTAYKPTGPLLMLALPSGKGFPL